MPKTFGAGQLRHVIKLQKRSETRNAFGEPIVSWTDTSSSVRANVVPLSGSETFNDPQMTSQEVKEFHFRYRSGVSPKDRIIYDSKAYNIEEIIDEDERRRKLIVTAIKVNT
jgi:SPP1 family predicted phage head-tail adaptor